MYKVHAKKKQRCQHALCRNCKQDIHVNHRCFIQPIADEEDLSDSEDAEEEQMREFEEAENGGLDDGQMLEPMICAMDFECTTDEMEEFEVVRVEWKYLGESDSYKEAETAMDVLRDAKARANENGKERKVCLRSQYAWFRFLFYFACFV